MAFPSRSQVREGMLRDQSGAVARESQCGLRARGLGLCVLPFVGRFPCLCTPVRMEHPGRLSRNSVFR